MTDPRSTDADSAAPCRLCRASAPRWARHSSGRRYQRCGSCGMIQVVRADLPSPEAERSRYLEHNNDPGDPRYVAYLTRFIESAVGPYVARGARLLDFGSGPEPVLSRLLEQRGYEVYSYDPFFAPDTSALGTVTAPWAGGTGGGATTGYDAVVLCEVFEHLFEPGTTLDRLVSLLPAGGALILRTSVFRGAGPRDFLSWWYRNDRTHVCFLAPETIDWICRTHRLTLEHHSSGEELTFRRRA